MEGAALLSRASVGAHELPAVGKELVLHPLAGIAAENAWSLRRKKAP